MTDEFAVDWSTAPDWAEFHAFDGPEYYVSIYRGYGCWYDEAPKPLEMRGGFSATPLCRRSGYTVLSPNWRDSIRKRPEKKMETPEWIYPGAECETRCGRQSRIYAIDGSHPYRVHGAILNYGEWTTATWTLNGMQLKSSREHPNDLIGPWRPWKSQIPPAEYFADWVKWVAMDLNGQWWGVSEEPEAYKTCSCWILNGKSAGMSSAIRMPTVPAEQWGTTKIRIRE